MNFFPPVLLQTSETVLSMITSDLWAATGNVQSWVLDLPAILYSQPSSPPRNTFSTSLLEHKHYHCTCWSFAISSATSQFHWPLETRDPQVSVFGVLLFCRWLYQSFLFKYNLCINNPTCISPSLTTPWMPDRLTFCPLYISTWIPNRQFKPYLSQIHSSSLPQVMQFHSPDCSNQTP